MANKKVSIGVAAIAAAGAATLVVKNKKKQEEQQQHPVYEEEKKQATAYRNTERGKHEKNSKGIYYTNGNYEAFANAKKPEGVDKKNAYIVGSGLASLAAACFLVRDGESL